MSMHPLNKPCNHLRLTVCSAPETLSLPRCPQPLLLPCNSSQQHHSPSIQAEIPSPAILRSNVEAVLQYFQAKDAQTEFHLSTRQEGVNTPLPKRFMKPSCVVVCDWIKEQFKHIDSCCLTDPPSTLINLHRHNQKTDIVFTARGTNSNERDNVDLASKILSATHVGLHHAERLITGFFEIFGIIRRQSRDLVR
jgi:hypothetical protein